MKQTFSYRIPDILEFQINRDTSLDFGRLSRLKFSAFQVDRVANPSVILNIGKFTPSNMGCYLIDHKYHVKENYLYCRDSEGETGWEIEISGLERGDTMVNFRAFSHLQLNPLKLLHLALLSNAFLLQILEHKLSLLGYFLAHAAAVAREGRSYLFCGRAGCFKTSLCMDFVRHSGFMWLGDDQVILHTDMVSGFPVDTPIFDFITRYLPDETRWSIAKRVRFAAERFFGGHHKLIQPPGGPARLKAVLMVTRDAGLRHSKSPLFSSLPRSQLDQIIESLIISNNLEAFKGFSGYNIKSAPYWRYLMAYSFVFPDSRLSMYKEQLKASFRKALKDIPVYQVRLPPYYSPDLYDSVCRFLNDIED